MSVTLAVTLPERCQLGREVYSQFFSPLFFFLLLRLLVLNQLSSSLIVYDIKLCRQVNIPTESNIYSFARSTWSITTRELSEVNHKCTDCIHVGNCSALNKWKLQHTGQGANSSHNLTLTALTTSVVCSRSSARFKVQGFGFTFKKACTWTAAFPLGSGFWTGLLD